MVRGSWEAIAWVDNFNFKRNLPWGIRQIYDLVIMLRISRTFDDKALYEMRKHMSKSYNVKIYRTLDMAILRMKEQRGKLRQQKQFYVDTESRRSTSQINYKGIEKALAEEERLINLTPEERRMESLKEMPYSKPITELPIDWIIKNCKVLEQHTDSRGVTFIKFDKVYQYYTGIVYSPRRKKPSGQQGYIFCAHKDKDQFDGIVKENYDNERGNVPLNEFVKPVTKQTKSRKEPDISHVKKAMGTNRILSDREFTIDDLKGDDIF